MEKDKDRPTQHRAVESTPMPKELEQDEQGDVWVKETETGKRTAKMEPDAKSGSSYVRNPHTGEIEAQIQQGPG